MEDRSTSSKKRKTGTSGGGGGPFRAFLHCVLAGTKFNKENLKAAARMYHQLSEEEKSYYRQIGAGATVAWQHGFKSFGERQRGRDRKPDAVAPAESTQQLVVQSSASSALIPLVTRDLVDDLREIRSKLKKHKLQEREKTDNEDSKIKDYQVSLVQEAPATIETNETLFHIAHAHHCRDSSHNMQESLCHIRWFPPASQLAAVPRLLLAARFLCTLYIHVFFPPHCSQMPLSMFCMVWFGWYGESIFAFW